MNLLEMESELFDTTGFDTSPDDKVVARFRRYLNSTYSQILSVKGLSRLRRRVLTFASVANTPFAVLPQAATRVIDVQDRTNKWLLDDYTLLGLREFDPGMVYLSSFPDKYIVNNLASPTAQDPSAAAELFVKSTSTADASGVTAYASGVLSNNYQRTANVTLNGLTAVSLGPTTWTQLTKFYLSAPANGDIILTQTSGAGTELARIPKGVALAKYTQLMLHPTPSAIMTYYADVELSVDPLANEYDEPVLPDDYHWLLPCGARMREYKKREKTELYRIERAEFAEGMRDLKVFMGRSGASHDSNNNGGNWSQLGPMFPAGS